MSPLLSPRRYSSEKHETQNRETEDIQLGEHETEMESAPSISHQADHEAEDLDDAVTDAEKQAEDDDLEWAQDQYPSPDPSIFEAFLTNSVSLPVEVADSFEYEGVDLSHENSFAFAATSASSEEKDCASSKKKTDFLEPAVVDQLEKQQNDRSNDFS